MRILSILLSFAIACLGFTGIFVTTLYTFEVHRWLQWLFGGFLSSLFLQLIVIGFFFLILGGVVALLHFIVFYEKEK